MLKPVHRYCWQKQVETFLLPSAKLSLALGGTGMFLQMWKDSAEYFHSLSPPWELPSVIFLSYLPKVTPAATFCFSWWQVGEGVPMLNGKQTTCEALRFTNTFNSSVHTTKIPLRKGAIPFSEQSFKKLFFSVY